MSTTDPPDSTTGRSRRDSVADLVYTSFRRRVDNPKHLFYLFPPDYRRQIVQIDPGEEHRTNMFKRRNSLRLSTRSEGGSRSKWGRRKQSVADVTAPPANDVPGGKNIVRGRSQSVPMVKLEPSGSDDEGPSRLQLRRSTNAYLELMWPRFFGSNRDVQEASEINLSRRHSEAGNVHSRHNSGGGGSGSHSRHNSGGGSNSSRHNSDSMTVLEEEGGLGLHDSGIHGGSSRSSLTSVTSVGDVFLDDVITPASSTHSLHNLKPEVEMRRRAASQSYLQHRASHNSQGSSSHKSTSGKDREEQILNPRALLLSSSSTGEDQGRGLPPRPSSYSGIGNEREKELLQNPSGRLSSGSRLGDESVRREGSEKKPASRPKSDVELRYEDVLEHLMWDVDVPETPPPNPTNEQLTPPVSSDVNKEHLTPQVSSGVNASKGNVRNDYAAKYDITNDITNAEVSKYGVTNDDVTKHGVSTFDVTKNDVTNDDVITPVSSNQSLQNMPSHPEVEIRRKLFSQSHSKQHSAVEQPGGPGNRNVMETNLDELPSHASSRNLNDTYSKQSPPAGASASRSMGQLDQGEEPYLELNTQDQQVESVLIQQAMKYDQNALNPLGGSGSGNRIETNLDELPSHATSKTPNTTYSKQAQTTGMNASRSMGNMDQEEQLLRRPSHSLTNKSRMGEQEDNRRSRRLSSSSLDGDLPTSRSSKMDELIPNPWYSRYSDSSLNLLDVTPGPESPEAGGGTTSTDSDVVEGISNFNVSDHHQKPPRDNASLMYAGDFNISDHHQKAPRDNAGLMYPGDSQGKGDLLQDKHGPVGEKPPTNTVAGKAGNFNVNDHHQEAPRDNAGLMYGGDNQGKGDLLQDKHGPVGEKPPRNTAEAGRAGSSSDSDAVVGTININLSDHQDAARDGNGNAGHMKAGNSQGRGKEQENVFTYGAEVDKAQGSGTNRTMSSTERDGDKKMLQANDNAKLGNNQDGYNEEVFMGDDGHGGMLQAMNNPKVTNDMMNRVHNRSEHHSEHERDALKPLMDANNVVAADNDDTVYTFTSVVEWTKDNVRDNSSSPDGPKIHDDEDSTTYTFSSKVEWNKQSQRGDEKEPLLSQGSAQAASVLESALEDRGDSDAHLEAYLDDVIQKHSSIVLQTEADPQFATGNALVSSDDRIRRQASFGVHTNPDTQFATDNAPKFADDNIRKQTNFGVHASSGPQSKRGNRENVPSRGQMERWKSGNDPGEDKQESGITEKWTLLSQGQAENTKVNSRSKGYGALQSGDFQDCRVRKGSVKLEKLKTKKVFTFCCFPFEFYW